MQSVKKNQQDRFSTALQLLQQQRLDEAAAVCEEILRKTPTHVDALRLLGSIRLRTGDPGGAAVLLSQALALAPGADTLNALACAQKDAGQLAQAEELFQRGIRQFPNYGDLYFNYGLLKLEQKNDLDAISIWARAIANASGSKKLYANYAVLCRRRGNLKECDQALAALSQLIGDDANEIENSALFFLSNSLPDIAWRLAGMLPPKNDIRSRLAVNIGTAALQGGDIATAIDAMNEYIDAHPDDASVLNNLALAMAREGDFPRAISLLQRAVSADPQMANAHSNLACIFSDMGDHEQAIASARKALQINPSHVDAMINLGKSLTESYQLAEAEKVLLAALEIAPENSSIISNLGNVCNRSARYTESISYYQRALNIERTRHADSQTIAETIFNLGISYESMGKIDTAIDLFKQSSGLDKSNRDCMLNLGITELTKGDFRNGWDHYFHRPRILPEGITLSPITPGKNFTGNTILIVPGQGLGDEVLFLRFCGLLRAQGAHVTYMADAKLCDVLKTAPSIDCVVSELDARKNFDYTFASDDLPLLLNINNAKLIEPPLRLFADPARVASMDQKLRALGPPPYLGLTWRAGKRSDTGTRKYRTLYKEIPIAHIVERLNRFECTVVNLQRFPSAEELQILTSSSINTVVDRTAANEALPDMLALLSVLDEYVAVSNTNIHLRASVARSARVLMPFPPEWRWMDKGRFSPWYPDIPIYRQRDAGGWKSALDDLEADLAERIKRRRVQ